VVHFNLTIPGTFCLTADTALGFPLAWLWTDRSFFKEPYWYTNGLFWLLVFSLTPIVMLLVYAGYRVIRFPTKRNVEASAGMTAIILVAFVDTVANEIGLDKIESSILSFLFGAVILIIFFRASKQVSNANNASKRTESTRSA
jgi:hypothetical protein